MGILPISPKILMTIVAIPDTESGRFLIERIDNAMVRKVNWIIQKNCVDLVIRPTNYWFRKKRDVKNCDAKSKIAQNSAILKKID